MICLESQRTLLVGDRRWPASEVEVHDLPMSADMDGYLRGFHLGDVLHHTRRCRIGFESGWFASVVWGDCTYSSNYHADRPGMGGEPFTEEPEHVEVGLCHMDHGLFGEPLGWVTDDLLNYVLAQMSRWPSGSAFDGTVLTKTLRDNVLCMQEV